MANEATAALSDAYGNIMHGDDAGSSAKIVWVVHPTQVPIDATNTNDDGSVGQSKLMAGENTKEGGGSGRSPGRNSGYLFTQKFGMFLCYCCLCIRCVNEIYAFLYLLQYFVC